MAEPLGDRRRLRGLVLSDKAAKTITVEVTRRFPHPKYGKMVSQKRTFHAHDEAREARVGDMVEIVECRPMSATKRWRLGSVVERNAQAPTVLGTGPETATA